LLPEERQALQLVLRQGDDPGEHERWHECEQLGSSDEALIVFNLLGGLEVTGPV
jgi:hypothetical protein